MKQPDPALSSLINQWLEKADRDWDAAEHLALNRDRFRAVIAFHCQHSVEKYLKALLVRHGIEFARTHDIRKLLALVAGIHPEIAILLRDADPLTSFGVELRYPGDSPELVPGERCHSRPA
jgi:HEPN domain-containing protein